MGRLESRRQAEVSVRYTRLVVLLVLFWMNATTGRAQELPFAHYTPDGGVHPVPSASISVVFQDTLGFIWVSAYSSGIVRYDGHRSELYTTEDGLRDVGVENLLEDARGRLWAGSQGGVVVSEDPLGAYGNGRRVRFVDAIEGMPLTRSSIRARAMALDAVGRMWVGTRDEGLLRYDAQAPGAPRIDTLRTTAAAAAGEVVALAPGSDGAMWVGLGEGGVLRYGRDGHASDIASGDAFGGSYPTALHEDVAGVLWIGTGSGKVFRATRGAGGMRIEPVGRRVGAGITDILTASDGTVWVASEGGGMLRLTGRGDVLGHYTRANGLLNDTVTRVLEDREGNLWFAQLGGLSKLRHNFDAFQNYSARSHTGEQPVLPAASVGAVAEAPEGSGPCRLWAATAGGGVACIGAEGQSAYLRAADGLYSDYVNALAVDGSGRLWIGTTRGVHSLSFVAPAGNGRVVQLLGQPATLSNHDALSVFSISVLTLPTDTQPASPDEPAGPVESVWFTHSSSLSVRIGRTWYALDASSGLPRDRLHAVAADASGRIWVATRSAGIYRSTWPITEATLAQRAVVARSGDGAAHGTQAPLFAPAWSTATGAPVDEIYGLLWHADALWAATASGVFALGGDPVRTLAHITARDGLGDDFSMSLALSPATGTLWAGTNKGLTEIDPTARRVLRTIGKADGLIDGEVWYIGSVQSARDGTIRFGTAGGLAEYRPTHDTPSSVSPLIQVRRVALTENNGRNEIDFEYAALSFANEREVRYRTRLVGYDTQWSSETPDVRIRYTNLPAVFLPRTYRFEVIARNADGAWSAVPLSYAFTIHPPLWWTWWAMSFYAAVLVFGAFLVRRIEKARVIKRERERARLREAELTAEAALARSEAAEAQAKVLASENERKEVELVKARELKQAYSLVQRKNDENERLLLNILPASVAERLRGGEQTIADSYAHVTILFSDLVGFTTVASTTSAAELVHLLNLLFSEFDRIAIQKGVEKIKTIGDAYMAVAGLPEPRPDHAVVVADMALEMLDVIDRLNQEHGLNLALRVGLHTGPVTAGVIGMHKFAYDVWGDAVNTAARMESHGVVGRIQVSEETRVLLEDAFDLEVRGVIDVKGKGRLRTYLLQGRRQPGPMVAAESTAVVEGHTGVS